MAHKGVDFYVQNALKFTYEHLQFQKFITPDGPPLNGEVRDEERREG